MKGMIQIEIGHRILIMTGSLQGHPVDRRQSASNVTAAFFVCEKMSPQLVSRSLLLRNKLILMSYHRKRISAYTRNAKKLCDKPFLILRLKLPEPGRRCCRRSTVHGNRIHAAIIDMGEEQGQGGEVEAAWSFTLPK